MKTRRDFLRNTTLAGLGMLSLPELAKAVVNEQHSVSAPKITVKNNAVILFQGDSITDCGRNREAVDCNTFDMIGPGYALLAATQLSRRMPTSKSKYTIAVSAEIRCTSCVTVGKSIP